jgi:hypothetical protein
MEAKIRERLRARSKEAPVRAGQAPARAAHAPARVRATSRPKSPAAGVDDDDTPSYMRGTGRSNARSAGFQADEKRREDGAASVHDRLSKPVIVDKAADTFYEAPSSFQSAAARSAPKGTVAAQGSFAKKNQRSRFSTYGGIHADSDALSTKHQADRFGQPKKAKPRKQYGGIAAQPAADSPPCKSGIPQARGASPRGARATSMERVRAAAHALPEPNAAHAPVLRPQFARPAARSAADVIDVSAPPQHHPAQEAQAAPPVRAAVARRGSALLAAALGGIGEDAPAMGDMGALAPPPPLQSPAAEAERPRCESIPQRPKRSPPKPPGMT